MIQAIPFQSRNYYKSVSENKEIVKLISALSTSISSTKKVHSVLLTFLYGIGEACQTLLLLHCILLCLLHLFYMIEQEVMAALNRFGCYHHIWRKDREDTMQKYVKLNG